MASYYYLIPSLPELSTNADIPISYEQFLDQCQGTVSKDTYELLEGLSLNSTKGPLVDKWAEVYGKLTKELNYQRSTRLGKDYIAPDKEDTIANIVNSALNAKNPLEAEKILLDFEFEYLDSLVGMHYFDDHVLFGYAIKLKLLERQNCFDHDKGQNEFKNLFDEVQERVYSL